MPARDIPQRIRRLDELALNLWWSWHDGAREVFRTLDHALWRLSEHNPIKVLHDVSDEMLLQASQDPAFLSLYDEVMSAFDREMPESHGSPILRGLSSLPGPVAFFSPHRPP